MALFDCRLLDPTAEEWTDAFVAATDAANRDAPRGRLRRDRLGWQRWVRHVPRRRPEGVQGWVGAGDPLLALVVAAWWTDALGRKHVLITASTTESRFTPRQLARESPLAMLFPESLILRDLGAGPLPVLVCGCGVAGPPNAIAWTGTSCGPCHDHAVERASQPRQPTRRVLFPASEWVAVLASERLLTLGANGALDCTDMATGGTIQRFLPHRGPTSLAATADGRLAVVLRGGEVMVFDAVGTVILTVTPADEDARCVAISQNGHLVAIGGSSVARFDPINRVPAEDFWFPDLETHGLAVTPDGRTVLAMDDRGIIHAVTEASANDGVAAWQTIAPGWREELFGDPLASVLVASPDGSRLAAVQRTGFIDVLDLRTRQWEPGLPLPPRVWPGQLAFSPDGRVLAGTTIDGQFHSRVHLWDVQTRQEMGSLGPPRGLVSGLAFSPDGGWLAVGMRGPFTGTRLWPWRELLGA